MEQKQPLQQMVLGDLDRYVKKKIKRKEKRERDSTSNLRRTQK